MANSIELAKKYLPVLDEAYQEASVTVVLNAPAGLVQETKQADTILIPKITLQGLGDYNRGTGAPAGDVTFSFESHTFTQDRGRKFIVDRMDNIETINMAFMATAGQFIRTKVVPEVDAYRFATIAAATDPANVATPATLTASTVDKAVELGIVALSEAEAPLEDRILFCTPTVKSLLRQSDNYVRNFNMPQTGGIDNRFDSYNGMPVVEVPQTRFYTAITLFDGTTGGQEVGGYIKNVSTGKDINFLLVSKSAVLGITKTANPRIFSPDVYQDSDSYAMDYRLYHDIFVPDNKTKGIYVHNKA